MPPAAKIIIFTERIETTELIGSKLINRAKGGVGLYHSGMGESGRTSALRRFEDGEIHVLVSCKALDEGFNVPEADVGIIVSSTNSDRQRIQRLGRILRKKGGGESRLYYLHIEDSTEEMTLLHALSEGMNGIRLIDMTYSSADGFVYPCYDELVTKAMAYVHSLHWSAERIREAERNIALGRVACDWLLSEEECRERIASARTTAEKNYYVTMLLLKRV